MTTRAARRWTLLGTLLVALGASAYLAWAGLRHEPEFYRKLVAQPPQADQADAFVSHTARLRNDVVNEPRWEVVFSEAEVNAWLATDLEQEFADRLPPGVSEPRVLFEPDRITLAFQLDDAAGRSVVWAVLRVGLVGENELSLALDRVQRGAFPIPAGVVLDRLAAQATNLGMRVTRGEDDGSPSVVLQLPAGDRTRAVIETLQIAEGWIRLAGTSRSRETLASSLPPGQEWLQSAFPRWKVQSR
jgi:hypothetical protein